MNFYEGMFISVSKYFIFRFSAVKPGILERNFEFYINSLLIKRVHEDPSITF